MNNNLEPGPDWSENFTDQQDSKLYQKNSGSIDEVQLKELFVKLWTDLTQMESYQVFICDDGCVIALSQRSEDTARKRLTRTWKRSLQDKVPCSCIKLHTKALPVATQPVLVQPSGAVNKPPEKSLLVLFPSAVKAKIKKSSFARYLQRNKDKVREEYRELVEEFINDTCPTAKKRKFDDLESQDEERPSKRHCPSTPPVPQDSLSSSSPNSEYDSCSSDLIPSPDNSSFGYFTEQDSGSDDSSSSDLIPSPDNSPFGHFTEQDSGSEATIGCFHRLAYLSFVRELEMDEDPYNMWDSANASSPVEYYFISQSYRR